MVLQGLWSGATRPAVSPEPWPPLPICEMALKQPPGPELWRGAPSELLNAPRGMSTQHRVRGSCDDCCHISVPPSEGNDIKTLTPFIGM